MLSLMFLHRLHACCLWGHGLSRDSVTETQNFRRVYLMLQNSLLSRGDPLLNMTSQVPHQKPAHTGPLYEGNSVLQPQTPRKAHESSYFSSPYANTATPYSSPVTASRFFTTPQRGGVHADQPSTPLRAAAVADGVGTTPTSRRCLGFAGSAVGVSSPLAATPHAVVAQPAAGYEFQTASLSRFGDPLPASPMSATADYYGSERGDVLGTPRSDQYGTADSGYQPMTPSCVDFHIGSPVRNVAVTVTYRPLHSYGLQIHQSTNVMIEAQAAILGCHRLVVSRSIQGDSPICFNNLLCLLSG